MRRKQVICTSATSDINKTKEYSIENATNKDIENFKEFQKNSKA